MEEQERTLLAIASRLLAYPDDNFIDEQLDIIDSINDNISSAELRKELENALKAFHRLTPEELKKLYVATFDLKAKHGLYLTAHELGDSSKRGAAIIRLQNIINDAGFERVDDELADYIPMLFEFLAAAPDTQETDRLVRRLAVAVKRIQTSMPLDNPYFNILYVLTEYVFPQPTKAEIKKLEFEREDADLEELPYPIMYG
ncbi:nitrate reductase molybdenum cofactor assembly chaperone [Virgibacillus doumboii]|uniref:nitrate reductase molybdenum cofactor assembly chaperone n=1 Tax=Virgibacillus doumboii TaxID=2697503 RepID=UPI0013DFF4EE|nr:nitrate reductase molybdenum cofactor assembly chaperone [Virgibacillus doumboii]